MDEASPPEFVSPGEPDGAARRTLGERLDAAFVASRAEPGRFNALAAVLAALGTGEIAVDKLHAHLTRTIVLIDRALNDALNEILHHPKLQRLEAAWRGVQYLVQTAGEDRRRVRIRILNASWEDLARDAEKAPEFDKSNLFEKVYEQEFGVGGGIPFSVLIGDYAISHRGAAGQYSSDLDVLASISRTASAAFAPFIAGVSPAFIGADRFDVLDRRLNFTRMLQSAEYTAWHALRQVEDMKYVGLTLPRVLMRLPYPLDNAVTILRNCRTCGGALSIRGPLRCAACQTPFDPGDRTTHVRQVLAFPFEEQVGDPSGNAYLWGNASFAFGAVLIRAFLDCSWLADIRGFDRDFDSGGVVAGLPTPSFGLDSAGVAPIMSTEMALDERVERDLAELGLVPLCHLHDTPYCAFFSNRSIYKPKQYTSEQETLNAQLSAMLQYTLCVARFSHYIKVLVRDKIGSRIEPSELQDQISNWLNSFVTPGNPPEEIRAQYPLRMAEVQIRAAADRPGTYYCQMRLWPHYQLDELSVAVRIETKVQAAVSA